MKLWPLASRLGDPPVTGGVTGQKYLCLCAFFFAEVHSPKPPFYKTALFRGGENGAFGKRSFCWGDTRHFRHFRRFPGSEEQNPLFCGRNAISEVSPIFVKTTCFRQGTKRPFSKTTVSATPTFVASRSLGPRKNQRKIRFSYYEKE